ncbi:MAG TPA: hypothetical protein VGF17_24460 [Phytomonospora sp.]
MLNLDTGDPVDVFDPEDTVNARLLTTNQAGYFGAFKADADRLSLTFGGVTLFVEALELYTEIKADAATSAAAALDAQASAETAAAGATAPTDTTMAAKVNDTASQTRTALDTQFKFPDRRVRYVDSVSGDDTNTGGSPSKSMKTVQAAIDSLKAMGAGGGKILLHEGMYAPITIDAGKFTIASLGSPQLTQIRTSSLTANGVTITGASAASSIAQVVLDGLTIVGPGKTSGGTGVGIFQKWTSDQVIVRNCVITEWGSHGHQVVDSYSSHYDDVLYVSNGGDGFNAGTNFNNTVFTRTKSISNGGRGYAVNIGASLVMLGADAEGNYGAGYDLRYMTAGGMWGCHMEGNGTDGVSPNIYLHASDMAQLALTRTVSFSVIGCLIQGKSGVTKEGLVIDGARGVIYQGNWFNNHGTNHVRATVNSRYTLKAKNTYDGTGTELQDDSGGYVQTNDFDPVNVINRVDALRFLPRSGNPIVGAQGNVWFHSTLNQMRLHDGTNFRTLFSGFSGSATLDFPSIPAGGIATLTITATGAAFSDSVTLAPPASIEAGLVWCGFVSAANTVTIRLHNVTAAAIDPASATWKVNVIRS